MTVKELHINVEQKLQEQGSYKRDRIFPEAIDLALREAEEAIIRDAVDDRFADKETRLTRVKPLLVKNHILSTYQPTTSEEDFEQDMVYAELPANLQYIVNTRAKVVKTKNCTNPTPVTAIEPTYEVQIPFPTTNLTTGPFYTNFKIVSSTLGVLYTAPIVFNNRFYSTEQRFEIAANVVDHFNKVGSDVEVYWETFNNKPVPDNFTFYSKQDLGTITITIYQANGTTVDSSISRSRVVTNNTIIDPSSLTNPNLVSSINPVRSVEPDVAYKALRLNSFTKTKDREPLGVETTYHQYIYTNQSFLVTNVYLDYIRKPQQISLLLNQTSELDSALHWEIIDKAIEILKLNIKDPSAEATIQYNQLQTRNN